MDLRSPPSRALPFAVLLVLSAPTPAFAAPDPPARPVPTAAAAAAAAAATPELPTRVSPDSKTHVQILFEGGTASMSRITAFPGAKIPVHDHPHSDELLLIEEGTGQMTLGDKSLTVSAGQAIRIPMGTKHSFTQTGDKPLRAVQVYAPAGPEQRFKKWRLVQ